MSDVKVEFKGSELNAGLDLDQDGVESIKVLANLPELFDEAIGAFKKDGEVKEVELEAKKVKFKLEGSNIKIELDFDQDGEKSLIVDMNLLESFDEGSKEVKGE